MFTQTKMRAASALCLALAPFMSNAEVLQAQANGFSIRLEAPIMAPPESVYSVLTERVGEWWHPAHTFSGDAANLSLDARALGCFCERLADGGSVRHLQVVFAAPGRMLRLQGGLGPLQGLAATGSMSWNLHAAEVGTRLELTYHVVGFLEDGMDPWAKPVESVLAEQVMRLKNLIETGEPGATEEAPDDELGDKPAKASDEADAEVTESGNGAG